MPVNYYIDMVERVYSQRSVWMLRTVIHDGLDNLNRFRSVMPKLAHTLLGQG